MHDPSFILLRSPNMTERLAYGQRNTRVTRLADGARRTRRGAASRTRTARRRTGEPGKVPGMHRRDFLRLAGLTAAVGVVAGSSGWRRALAAIPGQTGPGPYGPLLPPDANGIMLPAGFTSRVVARAGEAVGASGYVWPVFPDGGAVFSAK